MTVQVLGRDGRVARQVLGWQMGTVMFLCDSTAAHGAGNAQTPPCVTGMCWGSTGGMHVHRLKPLCGNICRSFKEVSSTPGRGAPEAQTSLCSSHLSFLRATASWHHTPAPLEPSSFAVTTTRWEQHLGQHGKGPLCQHMCSDGSVRAGTEVAVALLMASTQEAGPGRPSSQHEDSSPAGLRPGLAPHPHVLLLVQSFY